LYEYVGSNPVNNVDPSGRIIVSSILIGIAIGATLGGGGYVAAASTDGLTAGPSFDLLEKNWNTQHFIAATVSGAIAGGATVATGGALAGLGSGYGAMMLTGAAAGTVGGFSGGLSQQLIVNNGDFGKVDWGQVGINTGAGFIGGAVGGGVFRGLVGFSGPAANTLAKSVLTGVTAGAGGGAFAGGATAVYRGQNFWAGLARGAAVGGVAGGIGGAMAYGAYRFQLRRYLERGDFVADLRQTRAVSRSGHRYAGNKQIHEAIIQD